MLGLIGEVGRRVAGLISDVANTAVRVEGLNKMYGSRILVSGTTVKALKERYVAGQFGEAKIGFEGCLVHYPEDKATEALLARCATFLKEGCPKDWNGTFVMTSK